ncbi:hypothetical protein DL240_01605 [Lujinxingia litoralis]|uniref:Prepilin peptidase n=1 Tax=Lujinxingia litoralis TaxID=2211119 RepID=A0A328CCI6_9DELT|nr:A24 family peptidase [Lujinxingia litoralis]RAL24931.1 hypothetical protein DL240_01605 [Lujinxingia litoralis]
MSVDLFYYVLTAFAFALGAVVGSFLNVVIYRVPAGLSVVRPGSRCPQCETPIAWYDNIPILSWLLLRARCRHCEVKIPARYALVELLMGVLSAGLWVKVSWRHFAILGEPWRMGFPPPVASLEQLPWGSLGLAFGLYFLFIAMLVVITFVDLDHYLIPHEFTLPTIVGGVVAALVLNSASVMAPGSMIGFFPPVSVSMSLIGLVVGALVVIAIFFLYFAARGVEGIGGGDVTLMALMGAWLGWPALIFIFFAASVQGLIAAGLGTLFGAGFVRDSRDILAEEDPRELARREREAASPSADTHQTNETSADAADRATRNDEVGQGEQDEDEGGGLAVPFGPFIVLAGLEYFFFGEFLPTYASMSYLYYGF